MQMDILGMKHKISYVDKSRFSDERVFGQADSKACEILLSDEMPADMCDSTLLHEIIHIIDDSLGLKLSEKQVLGLETGLRTVVQIKGIEKIRKGNKKHAKTK